jgi:hypothetical protein
VLSSFLVVVPLVWFPSDHRTVTPACQSNPGANAAALAPVNKRPALGLETRRPGGLKGLRLHPMELGLQ